ncbi:universal stress protein [Mucilaginibacter boryungensis]|uniref:Universal stress protein n=1 Tax=Mucilaginibacter boryungensis TaxID=768480 RepID=A0ABR9XCL6_9SPHI|nr:universal stress protein [Mucilaginibacter boryungensis]MBE9664794.1 universal stress protein [Mucilaginibacter boryungensis]
MKKILIGIDDSKFAEHAVEYGFNLAHKLKAEVGLIHIIEPVVTAPAPSVDAGIGMPFDTTSDMVVPELYHIQDEKARTMLTAATKKYGKDTPITNFTEYGDTAEGIIKCSKDFNADMIVIGTHSRTGLDRLLMGSVAEHVIRHAEVPVLVVPMKEEDRD